MNKLTLILAFLLMCFNVHAAGKGGWSWGGSLGVTNASQSDLNTLIDRANTRTSGNAPSSLGNAWEFNAFISYRTASMFAWQFRTGIMNQSSTGNSHEYSVLGISIMPILRVYMLESKSIKFFSQFGVGLGMVSGKIKEANGSTGNIDYSGSDQGYLAGLGAEFCFGKGDHCLHVEGNMRMLGIDRVTSSDSGSGFASNSVVIDGREVELDNADIGITMSGVQGIVGYTMYF